jgi:cold shock CspA family protein
VKFYDANKGFGYIAGDDGWDYYFDAVAIRSGRPKTGNRVTFEPVIKPRSARGVVVL